MRRPKTAVAPSVVSLPPAGKFYHGVFPGGSNGMGGDIRPADVNRYQRCAGKRAAWVYFCNNWYESRAFSAASARWIRSNGSVPYIRLMLLSGAEIPTPDPWFNLPGILAGKIDQDLRRWMRGAREFGSPVIAEYGVEVNGWWFPWNGLWNRRGDGYADSVKRFREAYRPIIGVARAEKVYNVTWMFHVDPWDEPVAEWNRQTDSARPAGDTIQRPDGWGLPAADAVDRQTSDRLRVRHHPRRTPGLVGEGRSGAPAGRPRVMGFSWWNAAFHNDSVADRESNMRVQDSPALERVFRKYVGRGIAVLSRVVTGPPAMLR